MPRPVKDGPLRVGGRTVQVSSVAKPFFPEIGLTKGDLLAYYRDVAEVMLPHLRGRPLNLQRFPNGVDGAVTFHARTSTVDHLARPDLVVIDLDPDQGLDVVRAACDEVGLVPFVQTSGSRGYHVVMPLRPGPTSSWSGTPRPSWRGPGRGPRPGPAQPGRRRTEPAQGGSRESA